MATTRRRKSLALIDQVKSEPERFGFFQAVRTLETASAQDHSRQYAQGAVGDGTQPSKEFIRFRSSNRLHFSGADIVSVATETNGEQNASGEHQQRWLMDTAFFGLAGAQGVLPFRFSELLLQQQKNKSPALGDFFDLFNHRALSLFYQAWKKYRLPVNYETASQAPANKRDKLTQALLCLAGMGTSELQYRLPLPDEALAGLGAGLARGRKTADELKGIIKALFDLDVTIEQFKGQWQALDPEVACQLPGPENLCGTNNQLGVSAVIGSYCHHAQSKFSVVVAPLSYRRFMELAPGSRKLESLKSLIKLCVGVELEFDISVTTAASKVPPTRLVNEDDYTPSLGWNTHLYTGAPEKSESLNVHLSQCIDSPDEGLALAI